LRRAGAKALARLALQIRVVVHHENPAGLVKFHKSALLAGVAVKSLPPTVFFLLNRPRRQRGQIQ
jgi:hypothetical protein